MAKAPALLASLENMYVPSKPSEGVLGDALQSFKSHQVKPFLLVSHIITSLYRCSLILRQAKNHYSYLGY